MSFEWPGRWPDVFTRIRPYSWAAGTVALTCFGTATALRIVIGWCCSCDGATCGHIRSLGVDCGICARRIVDPCSDSVWAPANKTRPALRIRWRSSSQVGWSLSSPGSIAMRLNSYARRKISAIARARITASRTKYLRYCRINRAQYTRSRQRESRCHCGPRSSRELCE